MLALSLAMLWSVRRFGLYGVDDDEARRVIGWVPLFAFFAIKKGNVMSAFETNEKLTSQLPALQLLIGLGFEFLTPAEALRERQGRTSKLILVKPLISGLSASEVVAGKPNVGLFLPLRIAATWLANLPRVFPSASTT